jgi:integrase
VDAPKAAPSASPWCKDNPAQRFHRRVETPRERFLSKAEITSIAAALDAAEDRRAAAIVRQRQLSVPRGAPWLFPGDVPGQPVQEVRRFWAQIQKQCALQDVHIHDLRHTFASLLVSGGASLEMIGKLLGHSQMQTTLRYAHLMDSPLRAGVDAVANAFRPKPRLVHDADEAGNKKSA